MSRAQTFQLDIAAFSRKAEAQMDRKVREVCFEMSARIIQKTPVDTGRARANWIASIGSPSTAVTDSMDKIGSATLANAMSVAKGAVGKVFWLSNNLPYIEKLEYGSSKQAPQGMVRVTMIEMRGIINRP